MARLPFATAAFGLALVLMLCLSGSYGDQHHQVASDPVSFRQLRGQRGEGNGGRNKSVDCSKDGGMHSRLEGLWNGNGTFPCIHRNRNHSRDGNWTGRHGNGTHTFPLGRFNQTQHHGNFSWGNGTWGNWTRGNGTKGNWTQQHPVNGAQGPQEGLFARLRKWFRGQRNGSSGENNGTEGTNGRQTLEVFRLLKGGLRKLRKGGAHGGNGTNGHGHNRTRLFRRNGTKSGNRTEHRGKGKGQGKGKGKGQGKGRKFMEISLY